MWPEIKMMLFSGSLPTVGCIAHAHTAPHTHTHRTNTFAYNFAHKCQQNRCIQKIRIIQNNLRVSKWKNNFLFGRGRSWWLGMDPEAEECDEDHNSFELVWSVTRVFFRLALWFLIMVMVNLPDALQPQPHLDTCCWMD